MANPRKVYQVDPGLIPVFDRDPRSTEGHALETVVALELERRGAEGAAVRARDGFEVDFRARFPEGAEQLIQVCADLDAVGMRKREVRGLLAAAGEHPRATLHLVGPDRHASAADTRQYPLAARRRVAAAKTDLSADNRLPILKVVSTAGDWTSILFRGLRGPIFRVPAY
jgi:hypothetical protein